MKLTEKQAAIVLTHVDDGHFDVGVVLPTEEALRSSPVYNAICVMMKALEDHNEEGRSVLSDTPQDGT